TVGIYEGYISSIVNESRQALYNMFTWMNASPDTTKSERNTTDRALLFSIN
ncbi:unnamed protein product, partial [marine sediment metagenome]